MLIRQAWRRQGLGYEQEKILETVQCRIRQVTVGEAAVL